MPPAATSHEDIYHQVTSNSFSSASSPAYHHLPDYMMFLDATKSGTRRTTDESGKDTDSQQSNNGTNNINNINNNNNNKQRFAAPSTSQKSATKPNTFISASSTPSDIHVISDDHYHYLNIQKPQTMTQMHFNQQQYQQQQHYLTIEELKLTLNSCWLCGCNWQEDHVSLDCPECGGYAMSRPCPSCDGKCQQIWTRNITGTHDRHKATWNGQCSMSPNKNAGTTTAPTTAPKAAAAAATTITKTKATGTLSHALPSSSSCCSSQPSSATSSDVEEPDELQS